MVLSQNSRQRVVVVVHCKWTCNVVGCGRSRVIDAEAEEDADVDFWFLDASRVTSRHCSPICYVMGCLEASLLWNQTNIPGHAATRTDMHDGIDATYRDDCEILYAFDGYTFDMLVVYVGHSFLSSATPETG